MKNPSIRSHVANDIIKCVKGEAERLDARFSPVDDSRDLAGFSVGEDIHLAKIPVSYDQGILLREEYWKIFLYPGNRLLKVGGEVIREVVETRVAVFRDSRNTITIWSAAVLPGLRKEFWFYLFIISWFEVCKRYSFMINEPR